MKAQMESYFILFVFQVCHFYTTSKKADADMETVSKMNQLQIEIQVASATLVVWWPSLSSPYRCPQGMYLLPSIISGHQPFQELV